MVEASHIIGGLWQGSAPNLAEVQAKGFDAVALCAVEHQPQRAADGRLRVIRCPIEDEPDRMLSLAARHLALEASHEVAQHLLRGQNVLVTCHAGLNRSGLVSALALHMISGWDAETIIRIIRRKRSYLSLSNPDFVAIIQEATERPERALVTQNPRPHQVCA